MKKCQWQNCGGTADYRLYLEGGFVGYSCHSHAIAATSSGMEIMPIKQFRAWGAQGGKKSTRKLTRQEAKRMVAIREQKRAQKPLCHICGNPATCFGRYEDSSGPEEYACDTCCGHGNEDGHCRPIKRTDKVKNDPWTKDDCRP